jgi:hypothetical protein
MVVAILSMMLTFVMVFPLAFAQVPGAQIDLNAGKDANKNAWKNLGTAGGEFPAGPNGAPEYKPAGGNEPAQYIGAQGKIFGADPPTGTTPTIHLENWTVEFHLKRNGPAFADEHQIAGFRSFDPRHGQRIDIHFSERDTGVIDINIKGLNTEPVTHKEALDMGVEEWRRIAFVYDEAANTLQTYLDGKPVKRFTTKQDFDPKVDMNFHSLFDSHVPEHSRSFNGSMSIVRVYDKALTAAQILQNFEGRAIETAGKFTTTWARVKSRL